MAWAAAGCWDAPTVLATIDSPPAQTTVRVSSCVLPAERCSDLHELEGDAPWSIAVFVDGAHDAVALDVCAGGCTRVTVPTADAPIELTIHLDPFAVEGCPSCEVE